MADDLSYMRVAFDKYEATTEEPDPKVVVSIYDDNEDAQMPAIEFEMSEQELQVLEFALRDRREEVLRQYVS